MDGVRWHGAEWCEVVWSGVEWCEVEWSGVEWGGMAWNGVGWHAGVSEMRGSGVGVGWGVRTGEGWIGVLCGL